MYADVSHISLQQHQRPIIPVLDDTPIEYAKINHRSVINKKSMPTTAVKATVNDQHNGIIRFVHTIITIIILKLEVNNMYIINFF